MRRWYCIVTLLAGFSGDAYVWSARPWIPIPAERMLESWPWSPGLPEGELWSLS